MPLWCISRCETIIRSAVLLVQWCISFFNTVVDLNVECNCSEHTLLLLRFNKGQPRTDPFVSMDVDLHCEYQTTDVSRRLTGNKCEAQNKQTDS